MTPQGQLGSTGGLLDGLGNIAATFTYNPYGQPTASTGTTTTPFGFGGQYTDSESGLQYLRSRYYDPATEQFITRDPLEDMTGTPYAYVYGDPLNGLDPLGLDCGLSWSGAWDCVNSGVTRAGSAIGTTASDFGQGVAGGATDFGVGIYDMGRGVVNSSVAGLYDPTAFNDQWQANRALWSYMWDDPGGAVSAMAQGFISPYEQAICSGHWGRALGRGVFDVGSIVVGTKGAQYAVRGLSYLGLLEKIDPAVMQVARRIAGGHAWIKHRTDFAQFRTPTEFARFLYHVMKHPSDSKALSNGRYAYWDDKTETVIIVNPKDPDGGTAFVPDGQKYPRRKDYFNGLK